MNQRTSEQTAYKFFLEQSFLIQNIQKESEKMCVHIHTFDDVAAFALRDIFTVRINQKAIEILYNRIDEVPQSKVKDLIVSLHEKEKGFADGLKPVNDYESYKKALEEAGIDTSLVQRFSHEIDANPGMPELSFFPDPITADYVSMALKAMDGSLCILAINYAFGRAMLLAQIFIPLLERIQKLEIDSERIGPLRRYFEGSIRYYMPYNWPGPLKPFETRIYPFVNKEQPLIFELISRLWPESCYPLNEPYMENLENSSAALDGREALLQILPLTGKTSRPG